MARLGQPSMAERIWADQQSLDCVLNCMSACKTFVSMLLLDLVKELCSRILAAQNQLNCRGSSSQSHMTHHEGVVFMTPNILFNTANSHFCKGLSVSLPC
jgi:hypothetical protein